MKQTHSRTNTKAAEQDARRVRSCCCCCCWRRSASCVFIKIEDALHRLWHTLTNGVLPSFVWQQFPRREFCWLLFFCCCRCSPSTSSWFILISSTTKCITIYVHLEYFCVKSEVSGEIHGNTPVKIKSRLVCRSCSTRSTTRKMMIHIFFRWCLPLALMWCE